MSETKVTNLTYLYFLVSGEIDRGKDADPMEAHDAFLDGHATDFLEDHIEPPENLEMVEQDEIDRILEQRVVLPSDLGGQYDNGLIYVAEMFVELIQNGSWKDEAGREVEMSDVYWDF